MGSQGREGTGGCRRLVRQLFGIMVNTRMCTSDYDYVFQLNLVQIMLKNICNLIVVWNIGFDTATNEPCTLCQHFEFELFFSGLSQARIIGRRCTSLYGSASSSRSSCPRGWSAGLRTRRSFLARLFANVKKRIKKINI